MAVFTHVLNLPYTNVVINIRIDPVVRKPKKRHSSKMIADLKKKKMKKANPQKQEFGSPSLQASLRCQTHAFFATAPASLIN